MIKEINIGDRVYSTWRGRECTVKGKQITYELMDDEGNVFFNDESRIEKRRTYEEILMELAEKLKGTELHHCIDERGDVTFSAPSDLMGELDVEIEYTAEQLAAISAACSEIAANYKAKQEEQK